MIEIRVSKSLVGNWHRRFTDEPQNSPSFTINSVTTTRKKKHFWLIVHKKPNEFTKIESENGKAHKPVKEIERSTTRTRVRPPEECRRCSEGGFSRLCVFVVVGLHESFWKWEREFSKRVSKDFIRKLVFWILRLWEIETLFRGLKYLDIFFIKGYVRILWKNVKIWRQQLGGILVF